jgi:hypothetical protein
VPKDGRGESPLYGETVAVCDKCVGDLLYCDIHDAYLCPVCDRWQQEAACADPDCPTAPATQNDPPSVLTRIGIVALIPSRPLMLSGR